MGLADILTPTVLNSLNKLAVILGYAVGSTPPSNPVEGQMWFDTNYQYFKIYDGTQWVNVEPKLSGTGTINGDVKILGSTFSIADANGVDKLILSTSSILPTTTGIDIGSSTNKFDDVYATKFYGTATSACYADLAEKYTVDGTPDVGDVILISENDNYDCELSNEVASYRVLGVVSENPAYMMNAGLENGTYIALKGRVKCKVKGKVKKGDPLVSYLDGCAISIFNEEVKEKDLISRIFAKALESNNTDDVNIIEVVIL